MAHQMVGEVNPDEWRLSLTATVRFPNGASCEMSRDDMLLIEEGGDIQAAKKLLEVSGYVVSEMTKEAKATLQAAKEYLDSIYCTLYAQMKPVLDTWTEDELHNFVSEMTKHVAKVRLNLNTRA